MNTKLAQSIHKDIWAILPSALAGIMEQANMSAGTDVPVGTVAAKARQSPRPGVIAVIPVRGFISQRPSLFSMFFGGTLTEDINAAMKELISNPAVEAIVLDIDSPGGMVSGVPELAEEIRAMRGTKPIIAVANSMAASAAYYIGSQADEVVVTPSGEVGSIGVLALHVDQSRLLDHLGITPTFIQFGKNKTLDNPYEPLSAEARAEIQKRVDQYGEMFVAAVAAGRGVSSKKVMNDFGQGLMFGAEDAVRLGLADRVGTLDETLARLGIQPAAASRSRGRRAELQRDLQRATVLARPSMAATKPTTMQSVICFKSRFKTEAEASKWIRDHDFKVPEGGPDETDDSYRYRQRDPGDFEENSFRTIDIDTGVKGIIGKLK